LGFKDTVANRAGTQAVLGREEHGKTIGMLSFYAALFHADIRSKETCSQLLEQPGKRRENHFSRQILQNGKPILRDFLVLEKNFLRLEETESGKQARKEWEAGRKPRSN
jgi:hypothetical protein